MFVLILRLIIGFKLNNAIIQLCSSLRLTTSKYINIKDAIVKDNLKYGSITKPTLKFLSSLAGLFLFVNSSFTFLANNFLKIDTSKINQIYEFFVNSHWVPATGDTSSESQ